MALWTDLKAAIAAIVKANGNQEITGTNLQQTLFSIVDNVGENATYAGIATTSTNPGTPDGSIFYMASEQGTYSNFSAIEIEQGEIAILLWNGTTWVKELITASSGSVGYPFQRNATFEGEEPGIQNAIIDVEIKGGNKNWRVAPFTFERDGSQGHYIRLVVFDENDVKDDSVAGNGVIAQWLEGSHVEPSPVNGRIIEEIEFTNLFAGVTSAKMLVDWSAIPLGEAWGVQSYVKAGLSSRVFDENKIDDYVRAEEVPSLIPQAESMIWNRSNTFDIVPEFKEAILKIKVFGSVDVAKDYAIGQCRIADDGTRNFIGVYEYDTSTGVIGTKVALWDANPSYIFPTPQGGRQIDTVTLSEQNSSGITVQITLDFAKMPSGVTNPPDGFDVENFKFDINLLRNAGSVEIEGSVTLDFQVNGVDSRISTPNDYVTNGKPSYCVLFCHGNGQSYAYQGSVNWLAFCKANNIAIISTQGQDETAAPFTTNASGWGNYVHLQRYIALYKYAMDNFNLSPNIILNCTSMGGLIAGQLMYNKPFPITAAFLCGPVPDLSYIFANGGASRQEPIRNSYGMDAGGADDANLEQFIQGYDWYDLGLVNVSGTVYKFGFPKIYIVVGNDDSTFTVDFGGTAKYMEIVNAIKAAGGYISYKEIVATHADSLCFDELINDGVFEKELGI